MYRLIFFLSIILCHSVLVPGLLISPPDGPYGVSMELLSLTDFSRIDPYAPTGSHQKRRLMCSMFIPQTDNGLPCPLTKSSYMPNATAVFYGELASSMGLSSTTFLDIQLQLCEPLRRTLHYQTRKSFSERYPLFLFSPGMGDSRLLYTELAISLASRGYIVVTVDHAYDAPIIEFPDGTIIRAANISEDDASLSRLVQVRAADLSFVLNELRKLPAVSNVVDCRHVMAYGHSLGGATAAELIRSDERLLGGVNMDGRIVEPALSTNLQEPFLQVGRPNHRATDPTWAEFWEHLRGPKIELAIDGTTHGSFLDFSLLLELLGVSAQARSRLDSLLGSIPGHRTLRIMTDLLDSFGLLALQGDNDPLHQTISCTPELKVTNGSISAEKEVMQKRGMSSEISNIRSSRKEMEGDSIQDEAQLQA